MVLPDPVVREKVYYEKTQETIIRMANSPQLGSLPQRVRCLLKEWGVTYALL